MLEHLKIVGIDDKQYAEMLEHFMSDAPASLTKTHYELADETGITFTKWKKFLENPKVLSFIKNELATLQAANTRAARVGLGDATSNTDIQKTKQLLQMQKDAEGTEDKPFNLYAMPSEVKKYRDVLERIKHLETDEHILDIIKEVL